MPELSPRAWPDITDPCVPDYQIVTIAQMAGLLGTASSEGVGEAVDSFLIPEPINGHLADSRWLWTVGQLRDWENFLQVRDSDGTACKLPFMEACGEEIAIHDAAAGTDPTSDGWLPWPQNQPPESTPLLVYAVSAGDRRDLACVQFVRGTWLSLPFGNEPARIVRPGRLKALLFKPLAPVTLPNI